MGRPRLNKSLPPYASEYLDRHGKPRIRFRKTGLPVCYPKAKPGTAEFTQEYHAWLNSERPPVVSPNIEPHSFDDLISRYYASKTWKQVTNPRTQRVYRGEIERFRKVYGSRQVSGMTAARLSKLMGNMADTPSAANNLKKRLSQLFDFAILLGWQKDNPAKAVKPFTIKGDGIRAWDESDIAQFEAAYPVGTKEHLAFALLLYTAQRRSDAVRMGPQHTRGGEIRVKQLKTKKEIWIPIHPKLQEAIDACPSGHLSFLVSEHGKPFSRDYFGNWFRKVCDGAGLPECSAHGLRKAASRRMAELGLSNQQIKAITGHSSDAEVARYTKSASQVALARSAMSVLANSPLTVSHIASEAIDNGGE